MKKLLPLLLCAALLCGCTAQVPEKTMPSAAEPETLPQVTAVPEENRELSYHSRFDGQTRIVLSDDGVLVNDIEVGAEDQKTGVTLSHDIIYYEDRDTYESGNPYGEGGSADKHTAAEAAAHVVVNITEPGAYHITGKLSAGQVCVDLGEDAYDDPGAVVELILEDADITCTVAPAILFRNVYECDGNWSVSAAHAEVDTADAGANLILRGENTVSGSYVAKIYKDQEGEKKLWKQDGAIYSYMSLNVFGPGKLKLLAENEGLDTELHLTICGGDIAIYADNDGINTNEDGVSVTTIHGGTLHILAGLGQEGDGIDSNGYLVINGGTIVSAANPAADAGLDSDLGSYVNGGTVIALGSAMDWAESDSNQVTMNLQFSRQTTGSLVVVNEQGSVAFAYDPALDEYLGENHRQYTGAVISCPGFAVGETYQLYVGSTVTGSETGGVFDVTTVTALSGGTRMMYTGSDLRGHGDRPQQGQWPEGERPEGIPGGEWPDGEMPEKPEGERPEKPQGEMPSMPQGETPPQGHQPPDGQHPDGEFFGMNGEGNTEFYMQDKVNAFTGVTVLQ